MIRKRNGEFIVTNEKQNKLLKKLYGTAFGRMLLKVLTAPCISKAAGAYMSSPLSKPLIKRFISNNNIDTSQYVMEGFRSYNDFFTRRVKDGMRPVDMTAEHLVSPCDSKLSAYRICPHSIFSIKGSRYSVTDLLGGNKKLARQYSGGYCLIFRLEVDDYHRYCFFDSGTKSDSTFIKGELHTVNPVALRHYNIYKRNCREYTVLHTDHFGDAVQIEVGAMLVGKIANHHEKHSFSRGDEKGMFLFGGSTIVLLLKRNTAVIDEDIVINSAVECETVVKLGEKIGIRRA